MRCATIFALVVSCFILFPLRSWGGGPISIPGPGQGYQITKTDSSQEAPSGYEGRTDNSTQTAVGNTPATTGKHFVSHFTMGNQIKTCPAADGTSEGTGLFSISLDYTDAQANGTSTSHIDMHANAKYKGEVADNAYLEGAVKAEIDYTYNQSGSFHDKSGAISTTAPTNFAQHITIPFLVAKGMTAPDLGPFSGGDPTQGHYAEAFGVGTALVYWAGVYYSIAETKWLQGQCAEVVFSPPSYTLQPVLGGQVTVKADVKTKGGETTRGIFDDVEAFPGGSVDPTGGRSDEGYPLKFTYTAPDKKVANAGFHVKATSRAGVTAGDWKTGLGTGWSGQISCTQTSSGDAGGDEVQSWSNYRVARLTITVKDGVGVGAGYFETKSMSSSKRPVANYANPSKPSYVDDVSSSSEGTASGESKATVEVTINKSNGTYSISAGLNPSSLATGKLHSSVCIWNQGCKEHDSPVVGVPGCLPGGIGGKLSDPNQLHGEQNDRKTGIGRLHNGTYTYNVRWDLARSGSN